MATDDRRRNGLKTQAELASVADEMVDEFLEGATVKATSKKYGCTPSVFTRILNSRGIDPKAHRDAERYEPTEDDILQACAAIQSTWTEDERRRRATMMPTDWTVPMCSDPALNQLDQDE